MIYYVSHAFGGKKSNLEKAKKITHDLQVKNRDNCYLCPLLAFSHLEYGELGYNDEIELCIDLLMICDAVVVASNVSKGVQIELDYAKKFHMEVWQLDKNGELQPFKE
jgi:hypothetical protein